MHLARFPRRRYTPHATPLEKLEHLSRHLGGPDIWIKRDDLTGLTAGGNKTRKLEFLVADALENGADTLITVGAVQSNHCRLTLAAAVKEGLKCRLVLEQRVPGSYDPNASGNNFLFDLLGVEAVTVVEGGADLNSAMQAIADELKGQGRRGYIIPGGGSNPLGELRPGPQDRLYRLRQRQRRHPRRPPGRPAREQCADPADRHQCPPAPGRAGGQRPCAGGRHRQAAQAPQRAAPGGEGARRLGRPGLFAADRGDGRGGAAAGPA
jgi:hypothetical protein